uniref:Uncharacterized protein n=1 Tax=Kwoniella dejecticola CBS 10117 TaxID=1296121 RepID=A0A1A6A0S3_9TREE|nr:uncharacterized protein I303_05937 [Kwoniella dejecticola CBS 10117]OBR83657.1 hypothetical protein I303_05937 [Kwoniella dejecticola CBS 10117]
MDTQGLEPKGKAKGKGKIGLASQAMSTARLFLVIILVLTNYTSARVTINPDQEIWDIILRFMQAQFFFNSGWKVLHVVGVSAVLAMALGFPDIILTGFSMLW